MRARQAPPPPQPALQSCHAPGHLSSGPLRSSQRCWLPPSAVV